MRNDKRNQYPRICFNIGNRLGEDLKQRPNRLNRHTLVLNMNFNTAEYHNSVVTLVRCITKHGGLNRSFHFIPATYGNIHLIYFVRSFSDVIYQML